MAAAGLQSHPQAAIELQCDKGPAAGPGRVRVKLAAPGACCRQGTAEQQAVGLSLELGVWGRVGVVATAITPRPLL